jgi:hypothetical protein
MSLVSLVYEHLDVITDYNTDYFNGITIMIDRSSDI